MARGPLLSSNSKLRNRRLVVGQPLLKAYLKENIEFLRSQGFLPKYKCPNCGKLHKGWETMEPCAMAFIGRYISQLDKEERKKAIETAKSQLPEKIRKKLKF
jgi:hypothetical protein